MPTIVMNDVPQDLYDRLVRRAVQRNRTLAEVPVDVLREATQKPERLPEFIPGMEIDLLVDVPRPMSLGKVKAKEGKERLPDPLTEGDLRL